MIIQEHPVKIVNWNNLEYTGDNEEEDTRENIHKNRERVVQVTGRKISIQYY
ncbi:MAG: hypothetical protein LUO98_00850 [Methanoregula sp.]|nr:hypothetical protein [Methanoregula sp.]